MLSLPTANDIGENATRFAVSHDVSHTLKTAATGWLVDDVPLLHSVRSGSVPAVAAVQECESDTQYVYHTAISENLPECQLPASSPLLC